MDKSGFPAALIAISLLLAACAQEPHSVRGAIPSLAAAPQVSAAPENRTTLNDVPTPNVSSAAGASSPPLESTAPANPAPSIGVGGIVLAPPVLIPVGNHNLPAVLATNTTNQVVGFTVTATWKQAGAIGTATGAAQNVLPNQQRAVNLSSQSPIPDGATAVEAHVDRLLPPPPAGALQLVSSIRFGRITVNRAALSTLEVLVTNTDTVPHSFTVGAGILARGVLVGTAIGTVGDIGPHVMLPATLPIAGADSAYDQILVYVE
jgi:hypothetical protein